jgi:mono/diheme cytochrome c family protein
MRKLTALSVLLAGMIATASAGDCPNGGVCLTPTVQTVVTPVATAITLPIYGAAYQPVAASADDDTKALLKALIDEVRALRADLAKGAPTGQPSALAVPKEVDPVAVLKTACAACHTGEKSKGGFLIYTDKGESVKLSPADRREMTKRIANGNMPPPPGKLGTAEKDAVVKALK